MEEHMPMFLTYYDKEVVKMISLKYGFSYMKSFKLFIYSETYQMLRDVSLEMWDFGCPAIFDMWECEQIAGSPRKSTYIREM